MKPFLFVLVASLFSGPARSQEDGPGQVRLPLEIYNQLVESSRTPVQPPRPAPAAYALGNATVTVRVPSTEPRPTAEVSVNLSFEVFESEWILVPVLPPGTPVSRATLQGNPIPLVATPSGLAFGTNQKGSYTMDLFYQVDASSSAGGYALGVPTPAAASIQLSATLPGSHLDVSVIPAAGVKATPAGSQTNVTATIPSTSGVQIAWRAPSQEGPSLNRAFYRGEVSERSVVWRAELEVELFTPEATTVRILPASLTLTSLTVDGKSAPILVEKKRFATLVRGQGTHRIVASFETPVAREDGPPRTELLMPEVPVSRIELVLPGKKDVSATPSASVRTRPSGGTTVASVHVPLTERVALSWSEAIPEATRRELRATASVYHVVRAEEGVLFTRAHVVYEVQNGSTSRIEIDLPAGVEVNQVSSDDGAISDWRVESQGSRRTLRLFLDRELTSSLTFAVDYDRSLGPSGTEALQLLSVRGVGRQRGMVALVSSRDRALEPDEASAQNATRVGENQLPPFVRDAIDRTIAHTFKYNDAPPSMRVLASEPERVAGRFDAQVDTLLTLGEVTLGARASVEIHVKSGGLDRLDLVLPETANLLNLVAPSLRTHRLNEADPRVVEIEFTQQMEGDFRIELAYERLLEEGDSEVPATMVRVRGADVEQGRVAVEASSAVEVAPTLAEGLSPLDVRELPRQLVLQTSHPILHAFKYARSEPEPRLSLGITRHPLVTVAEAVIDRAEHRTLFTRDGLAVTATTFTVRNARKQFLRVRLPAHSEIWSAFVAGEAVKPALGAGEDGEDPAYLIKIVSSSEGFPVELVFATRVASFSGLGAARARLPHPDLLVTESRWDLYLPEGLDYGSPSTNMNVVLEAGRITGEALAREMGVDRAKAPNVPEPFRITVPTSGVHYAFEMLYANHGDVEAYVAVPYSSRAGSALGMFLTLLGVAIGFLAFRASARVKPAALALAALLVAVPIGFYGVTGLPALVAAVALTLLTRREELKQALARVRPSKPAEQNG